MTLEAAPGTDTIAPSVTLYVRGLNDKISKTQLKRLLFCLFSEYGRILDIVALKTIKMRGQAFIVFEKLQDSAAALRALQGFMFLEKPMIIAYAKERSNILNVVQGSYKLAVKNSLKRSGMDTLENARNEKKSKRTDETDMDETMEENEPTNPILFVSKLPPNITNSILANLFLQYAGFKEVRLVPGKPGLAFVEFDAVENADVSRRVLDGFEIIPNHPISVDFAKS